MEYSELPQAPRPWQAPPAFVAHALLAGFVSRELRWGLCIAPLRLVSRDWRAAVDGALPVLAPRPHVPPDELAALARRFGGGLRLVRLQSPSNAGNAAMCPQAASQHAAALQQVAEACPELVSLALVKWGLLLEPASLQPLSRLSHLRRLHLSASALVLGSPAALPQLPQLRSLRLACRAVRGAALAGLSGLTELDLSMEGLKEGTAAELLAAVAQLRQLHQLGLRPELAIPGADWLRLSALQHLTSLSLRWLAEEGAEGEEAATPLLALLAQLGCGRGGGGGRGGGLRQLSLEARTQDGETPVVPLHALSALEALTWVAPNLQTTPPSDFSRLAGLTALKMDLGRDPEAHTRAVAAIGRRLRGLRRLDLVVLDVLETALVELSGLTQLTSLSLLNAHELGGQALAALLPLTRLARLSLSMTVLNDASLEAVLPEADDWSAAQAAARAAPGASTTNMRGAGPEALGDAEQPGPPVLPGLTYLCLQQHHLLSGAGLVRLATSMPSLRHLVHLGWPNLETQHLQRLLQRCSQLQLLQTTWRPSPALPPLPDGFAKKGEDASQELRRAVKLAMQQHQVLQEKHDNSRALCRAWPLKLQHSLPDPVLPQHAERRV